MVILAVHALIMITHEHLATCMLAHAHACGEYSKLDTNEKEKECNTAIGAPRMDIVATAVYKYAKAWFQYL